MKTDEEIIQQIKERLNISTLLLRNKNDVTKILENYTIIHISHEYTELHNLGIPSDVPFDDINHFFTFAKSLGISVILEFEENPKTDESYIIKEYFAIKDDKCFFFYFIINVINSEPNNIKNSLESYLEENIIFDENNRIKTKILYKNYLAFCDKHLQKPLSNNMVTRLLSKRGVERKISHGITYYYGISFK